jgi:predicted RNA-binding protein with PIN domain
MSSRRELLIDAYNVIFADPRLGPLVRRSPEEARDQFLEYVRANRPADSSRVTVVFDAHRDSGFASEPGRQNRSYSSAVHVVFARETADVWIQRRVRNATDPARITVVTSDREIVSTVRACGALHLTVSEFLGLQRKRRTRRARTQDSTDKPDFVSRRELEEWERIFGERSDDD